MHTEHFYGQQSHDRQRHRFCWGFCRSVGVRLGKGEALADILASSNQVAEGVSTAGVVVGLARTYRVSLPVLTAVAQVRTSHLSAHA